MIFLINRSPEPSELGVPIDEDIFLEVVDDTGAAINLAATKVYLMTDAGPEVLAFDAGTFQPGFTGANSATSSVATGIRRINIDLNNNLDSLNVVSVRVVSANNDATPILFDGTYSFTVEDLTPPILSSAKAQGLSVVRVIFDEVVTAVSASNSNDALNPVNYSFVRLTAPAVDVVAESVTQISGTTFDILTDIDLSPSKQYRVLSSNVEDSNGNAVAAPFNFAEFVAFKPAVPADRAFVLFELLPLMNRQEDVTEDLSKFIACLQEPTDLLLADIDRFPDILDPDFAEEQYVDAMLVDLANPFGFADSLSLVDKRRLVQVLVDIYKLKGTEVGIIKVVLFLLGLTITIDEYATDTGMSLGDSELGSDGTDGEWVLGPSVQSLLYSFTVVSLITLTTDQKDKITQIVELMKPAHTHFVAFVEPVAPAVIDHLELGLSELGVEWELH